MQIHKMRVCDVTDIRHARFHGKCTNSHQHVGDVDTDQCDFDHVLSIITLWVTNGCTRVSQHPTGTSHHVMTGCSNIDQHVDEVNTNVAPETCSVNNAVGDQWVYQGTTDVIGDKTS